MTVRSQLDGRAFAAARALLGLTQGEVSAATTLSPQTLCRIEKGASDPKVSSIHKLLEYYATFDVQISRPNGRISVSAPTQRF